MTANVTSIAKMRAAARDRAERIKVNNRTATTLLVLVVVLVVIGLGATQSASSAVAIEQAEDRFYFFKRQLVGVGIGTVALLVASRIPYQFYRKIAIPFFVATVALLVAVLAVGPVIGGAQRWLPVAGFSFQPSELAKVAVVFALAYLLEKKHKLVDRFGHFLVPVVFIVGTIAVLVMKQPDLGTVIVIGAAALAVILASDAPLRYVAFLAIAAILIVSVLAFSDDYRADRIVGFLDPWGTSSGEGYQLVQSYYALSNGGIFGVGLGASRARWFYLPNAHTDFIFAIIGEETGLIGALTVIGLFVVLALAGWMVALRAPDRFGRMVAAGITVWLSFQALVNIGGVLGVLPITGIALPFISFGSTALIASMAALGVLVNIAQAGVHRKT
ncbi:MAG TPA: putative lipid II flippase FtsW [Acidimicrobiia bacterium]|nr:putative lipid II flippase FtsW [Acidimicrobiia bacterium]